MADPRITQIADILVNYSLGILPGDKMALLGNTAAAPLVREVYRQALRAGAHVTPHIRLPGMEKIFFAEADQGQLEFIDPQMMIITEEYDALINIAAPANTREGAAFDPAKRAIQGKAMQPFMEDFYGRADRGEAKWCATRFPCAAYAQEANMSMEDFEDFYFGACLPDPADPIGYWKKVEVKQNRITAFLSQKSTLRVVATDTDLSVGVKGRNWLNSCGHRNFPDGEVFTGPIETETQGHIHFSFPALHDGVEVHDARLEFENGRVVNASAGMGESYLLHMLDRDEGSRILGEFAIGTNPGITKFTRETLFDEKMQGTIHTALGMAYPASGGVNKSQIHWDMVCDLRDGGQIYADDELIYENGEFVVDFE